MALSNTATPIYYGRFRDKVLAGEIPVCREIEMEMNRINALIANPAYYYDDRAIDGWIKFCEAEMTLTDGSDVYLLDSFKLWAEALFGWWYFLERTVFVPSDEYGEGRYVKKIFKKRLITKQFIISGRGSAKSMYPAFIHAYFLTVDPSTTQQVTTAPTMKLAEAVIAPIKTAITRARGPYFKFLTEGSLQNTTGSRLHRQKLCSTKKGIENFLSNSILQVEPMTIDKLQSRRDKIASIDEWLSGDVREDVVTAIEQGASKNEMNDDYLIIATSSEGTVRNGSGDSIKMELADILKGDYPAPNVSIWWYKLDDIREVADPRMWVKANPNLGITVSYEVYQADVERAENAPAARNDIIAKRFGIPMEGYTYFFTYEETLVHKLRPNSFFGMRCAMGIDLSKGDDFCAFTFLFPLKREEFGVKTRCYISSRTLHRLPGAMREKYNEFMKEGSLVVLEGNTLDMTTVYEDLDNYIITVDYDVCAVGYDPYNAGEFMERWMRENSEYACVKVPQGRKTETVPLGELKILAEQRLLLFDEELMKFAMGNCITLEDINGQRMLMKKRYDQKIDSVSALMDAYVAYKAFKDEFQ